MILIIQKCLMQHMQKCNYSRLGYSRHGIVTMPAGDLATARTRLCSHGSKSEPKSPNPANRLEKTDFERSAKHGLLCQIQSRHLNVFFLMGNLGNPDSVPKATCPSSPKLPRLGNLGTIGEGHFVSTPVRPIKDRPLLTMISIFENFVCSYSGY